MISNENLTDECHSPSDETRLFLNTITLKRINLLKHSEISTKDCHFFGNNDIYILKDKELMMIIFSRDAQLVKPIFAEYDVTKINIPIQIPTTAKILKDNIVFGKNI